MHQFIAQLFSQLDTSTSCYFPQAKLHEYLVSQFGATGDYHSYILSQTSLIHPISPHQQPVMLLQQNDTVTSYRVPLSTFKLLTVPKHKCQATTSGRDAQCIVYSLTTSSSRLGNYMFILTSTMITQFIAQRQLYNQIGLFKVHGERGCSIVCNTFWCQIIRIATD